MSATFRCSMSTTLGMRHLRQVRSRSCNSFWFLPRTFSPVGQRQEFFPLRFQDVELEAEAVAARAEVRHLELVRVEAQVVVRASKRRPSMSIFLIRSMS